MNKLRAGRLLFRYLGAGWLLFRVRYALRKRLGFLKRATPDIGWAQIPAPPVRLARTSPSIERQWGNACLEEAEAILRGEFRIFSNRVEIAGFPPDWLGNSISAGGRNSPETDEPGTCRHWTEISDAAASDIKGVWELSRFAWAFILARAHARTGDSRYSDGFWRLFHDWCARNPPNRGPNWMCGQEAAFRLVAAAFAAEALGVQANSRELLARFVVATGRRIAANLDYALSQKNNHGISECVGLITAALLVPEHEAGDEWLMRGLRSLNAQCAELIYPDGGFSQHSLIYHRVLLHDLCWCHARLRAAGRAVPPWLEAAGRRATDFLINLADPTTGRAPLYGANDGTNLLPLAEGGFLDLRPAIQSASAVFRSDLPLQPGPWDEAAAWLVPDWNKRRRVAWPAPPSRWHAVEAGCFQLTTASSRLFLRCPRGFRHRPSQADTLHVDIYHGSRPVAIDGGSFSYNSSERFTALKSGAQHNVLTVEGVEPMQKLGRFLYLPWPEGSAAEGSDGWFEASDDGYAALGMFRGRSVRAVQGGGFEVKDVVRIGTRQRYRLHWRLSDSGWRISDDGKSVAGDIGGTRCVLEFKGLPKSAKLQLLRADTGSAYGWHSPQYGAVEIAVSLLVDFECTGDVAVLTTFDFADAPPGGISAHRPPPTG